MAHPKRIAIIGGGVGGLAAACLLGKAGHQVAVFEKNSWLGGRAGLHTARGFRFDTGPSWYLMPDVFERFFGLLGEDISAHLSLVRLQPSFRVWQEDSVGATTIYSDLARDSATFEGMQAGSGAMLHTYLDEAARLYKRATNHLLYKDYTRQHDILTLPILATVLQHQLTTPFSRFVAQRFQHPLLQHLLTFPALFVGGQPAGIPALYRILSHAIMTQGVYYPMGGMYQLVEVLHTLGKGYGIQYFSDTAVQAIPLQHHIATGVMTSNGQYFPADIVVSDAGVQHTETALLPPAYRDHTARYWQSRTLAPSALLLYLGVNRQYSGLAHHNLLFSKTWDRTFRELFDHPTPPTHPSLYVCAPSRTDPSVAPPGHENLFVLVPLAAGISLSPARTKALIAQTLQLMEHDMGLANLASHIAYQHHFCAQDFLHTFNTPGGSGLGIAHTLRQTAFLRPSLASRRVKNLYYVGADVHPGIGLPSVLISAELAWRRIATI